MPLPDKIGQRGKEERGIRNLLLSYVPPLEQGMS
jgi:hypothetical protein